MSDKLRSLFPVPVSFVAGEQPTASKLNALSNQVSAGLDFLEKGVGDLKSDSHPLFPSSNNTPVGTWAHQKDGTALGSEQRHLQVLNLARLIGPASALNPRILGGLTATITEDVPSGQSRFYLRFRPVSGTVTFSNATKFANLTSTIEAEGDYSIAYGNYGYVTVAKPDPLDMGTVTYDVDTSGEGIFDSYAGASFNVMPDPNQATKCTVAASGSRWGVTLPTITHQQADWDEFVTALGTDDLNYTAQLRLPQHIQSEYVAGEMIAGGLLGLWDGDNKLFIEDAIFYYVSATVVEVATGETLEISSDRYSIVTLGTDITRTLDRLRTHFSQHQHNGNNGDRRVNHHDLSGLPKGFIVTGGRDYTFLDDGALDFDNDHPQYLGRWGADSSWLKNAILGNLLIASAGNFPTDGDPPFDAGTSNSYGIFFSNNTSGTSPYLRWSASDSIMEFANQDVCARKELKTQRKISSGTLLNVGGNEVLDQSLNGTPTTLYGSMPEGTILSYNFPANPFNVKTIMKCSFVALLSSPINLPLMLNIRLFLYSAGLGDITIARGVVAPLDVWNGEGIIVENTFTVESGGSTDWLRLTHFTKALTEADAGNNSTGVLSSYKQVAGAFTDISKFMVRAGLTGSLVTDTLNITIQNFQLDFITGN